MTAIDDGAIIVDEGSFRIINYVLLLHPFGYAGTFNYNFHTTETRKLEIVNSAFGQVHAFYVNTTDLRARNNR